MGLFRKARTKKREDPFLRLGPYHKGPADPYALSAEYVNFKARGVEAMLSGLARIGVTDASTVAELASLGLKVQKAMRDKAAEEREQREAECVERAATSGDRDPRVYAYAYHHPV